ncbi:MAG TPA: hypothetical protein VGR11_00270 [Solirubrobacteraceae bacterium]|nr:hypothetical protein [Solirubrobacteraceae bacterium]
MNAISEYLREQAAAHRATAAEKPDDPRYLQSAAALEALAAYADAGAEQGVFQMRYLLEHHVVDGRFAWADGQCGRSIMHFGFDAPVRSEGELEQFLMDLCDMAKSDAARHIGSNESEIDRGDAAALAERYGIGVDRVHGALDAGRGIRHVFAIGIPAWHEPSAEMRAELEAIDGVIVEPGKEAVYGKDPPLIVKNVPAPDERQARERVAQIVGIEPGALGASPSQQRVI